VCEVKRSSDILHLEYPYRVWSTIRNHGRRSVFRRIIMRNRSSSMLVGGASSCPSDARVWSSTGLPVLATVLRHLGYSWLDLMLLVFGCGVLALFGVYGGILRRRSRIPSTRDRAWYLSLARVKAMASRSPGGFSWQSESAYWRIGHWRIRIGALAFGKFGSLPVWSGETRPVDALLCCQQLLVGRVEALFLS
jgi:hypothetical protein